MRRPQGCGTVGCGSDRCRHLPCSGAAGRILRGLRAPCSRHRSRTSCARGARWPSGSPLCGTSPCRRGRGQGSEAPPASDRTPTSWWARRRRCPVCPRRPRRLAERPTEPRRRVVGPACSRPWRRRPVRRAPWEPWALAPWASQAHRPPASSSKIRGRSSRHRLGAKTLRNLLSGLAHPQGRLTRSRRPVG
jgi:hypothetical protein